MIPTDTDLMRFAVDGGGNHYRRGERKIVTEHVFPPIPIRSCDWCATFDGYEPGDPQGWGATEAEAIRDLHIEVDARED